MVEGRYGGGRVKGATVHQVCNRSRYGGGRV